MMVGVSQSVWAGYVPDECSPLFPGHNRGNIWALPIRPVKARGFQVRWDLRCIQGPLNHIVDACTMGVASLAESTAQTVCAQPIHQGSAMHTLV